MKKDLRREFTVTTPLVYESYPLATPEEKVSTRKVELFQQMVAKPPEAAHKTAVWVVHGMGQQVPFATLEQVAEGIIAAAGDTNVANLQYREVKVDKTVLQRVELTLNKADGKQRQVDVYECYWAPKTEGAVKLRNVIDFLWDGGTRGLINSVTKFERALFGRMDAFNVTWRTPTYLLITLATLAALMVINAIILATGATIAGIGNQIPNRALVMPLTAIAGLVSAAAITFGAVLAIAEATKPVNSESWWGRTIRNLTWFGVVFTIVAILAGAGIMAAIFWKKWDPAWLSGAAPHLHALTNVLVFISLLLILVSRLWRRHQVSKGEPPGSKWLSPILFYSAFIGPFGSHRRCITRCSVCVTSRFRQFVRRAPSGVDEICCCARNMPLRPTLSHWLAKAFSSPVWVWPFLVIVSAQVRTLLVEYVGDVTAYVASNKVDSFDELRAKIKALAKESLSAVYSAKSQTSDQFEYDHICVVGHSLGSVIAYDTLNRLIADDQLAGGPARVVDRTGLLLTFGSPLDKTAFFFSVIGKTTRHIREQLAAVVQPLIQDRVARDKIEWVNVYSRNDIISGSLDFYQFSEPLPEGLQQVRKVVNVKDKDALVPLVAHVEYWTNPTVWSELLPRL